MAESGRARVTIETVDDVTVATVAGPNIFDDAEKDNLTLQETRDALYTLAAEARGRKLLVNLRKVEYAATEFYAGLLVLNRRIEAAGGRLRLCCLQPDVQHILHLMRLDRILAIDPDEQTALDHF